MNKRYLVNEAERNEVTTADWGVIIEAFRN